MLCKPYRPWKSFHGLEYHTACFPHSVVGEQKHDASGDLRVRMLWNIFRIGMASHVYLSVVSIRELSTL
jgi:hypothetical protein